jgi:hypothetical protein
MGGLVVVNKLRSRNSTTVALGVKYQAYADRHHEAEPTAIILEDLCDLYPPTSRGLSFS